MRPGQDEPGASREQADQHQGAHESHEVWMPGLHERHEARGLEAGPRLGGSHAIAQERAGHETGATMAETPTMVDNMIANTRSRIFRILGFAGDLELLDELKILKS